MAAQVETEGCAKRVERFKIRPEQRVDLRLEDYLANDFLRDWFRSHRGLQTSFHILGETTSEHVTLSIEPKTRGIEDSGHVRLYVRKSGLTRDGYFGVEDVRRAEINHSEGVVSFIGRDGIYEILRNGLVHRVVSKDRKRIIAFFSLAKPQ
jgi:hypothetical protein